MSTLRLISSNIENLLSNEYVSTGVVLFLVLYTSMVAPNMSENVVNIINNPAMKLIAIYIGIHLYTKNKSIALLFVIGFITSLQTVKKMNVSDTISAEIALVDHPAEEIKVLVEEEIKRIVSEEAKKPVEERRPEEEIRQIAEERVESKIIEESRKSSEEIRPSEEQKIYSEVPAENNIQEEVRNETKNLVEEEIKKIISEEMKKPEEERKPQEEILQIAEERVERHMMEESRRPEEEIKANESNINNMPIDNVIQDMVQEESMPINRVLVEEELKKSIEIPKKETQIPLGMENSSLANINSDNKSLLEEQIKNSNNVINSDVKARSNRGLKINKKCNLCNNKGSQNNNIEIKAFGGNTFAEF